jgi:hypothetical protein
MATQRPKSTSTNKKKITHICNQEEEIARHGELLNRVALATLGNGTPENGLLFMFRAFLEREKERKEDIKEIKNKLEMAISSSNTTAKALDMYKAEMGGIDIGKKETEEKKTKEEDVKLTKNRDKRFTIFQIIALTLTLIMATVAVISSMRNGRLQKEKGTPYVSNSRGQLIPLPDSSEIRFFPYDSMRYVIKKVE